MHTLKLPRVVQPLLFCVVLPFLVAVEVGAEDRAVRVDHELQRLFKGTGDFAFRLHPGDTNASFGRLYQGAQLMFTRLLLKHDRTFGAP